MSTPTTPSRPRPSTRPRPQQLVEHDIDALLAERNQFKDIALRLQADFENYRKRVDRAGRRRDRPGDGRWPRSCCRCSTPARPRSPTASTGSSQSGRAARRVAAARVWRCMDPMASPSTPPRRRPCCTSRARGESRSCPRCSDAVPLEGEGAAGRATGPRRSAAAGLPDIGLRPRTWSTHGTKGEDERRDVSMALNGSGSRRTTTRSSAWRTRPRQGDHQGVPQAGSRVPPRRQPR